MKKKNSLLGLITIVFIFCLTSCGDKNKSQINLPVSSDTLRYDYFIVKGEKLGVKAEYQVKTEESRQGKQFKKHGYYREYYTNGQLKAEFNFYEDVKNGSSKTYYQDGKIYEVSEWTMDELDGPYKLHYPNGVIWEALTYNKGLIDGEWQTFFQDNSERFSFTYKEGLIMGMDFLKDSTGTILMEKTIENGDGVFYSFYRDGSLKSKCEYKNGLPNGAAEYYFLTGELVKKGGFKDGLKHGKWTIYSKGEKIKEEVNYNQGRLVGTQRIFYPSGKLNSELSFKENIQEGVDSLELKRIIKRDFVDESSRWDQPSNIKSIKEGRSVFYYANGNIKQEGSFINDMPIGRFTEYYEDGNVKILREHDSTYINNIIFEKYFDINGIVVDSVFSKRQNQ